MYRITKLWLKTKFYIASLLEILVLMGVTWYAFTTLFSILFLRAYLYSSYISSLIFALITFISITAIFTIIVGSIWANSNNMDNELWSEVLDDTRTIEALLEQVTLAEKMNFLIQYDKIGETAFSCAERIKKTDDIQRVLKNKRPKPRLTIKV